MYFSRIQLKESLLDGTQLGSLLQKSSYNMHSLLWDLFEKGERFLFREETSREQLQTAHNRPVYYVLSHQQPADSSPLFTIQSKPFEPALKAGDNLYFKLRANPTVSRKVSGKHASQRHDVLMDAQRQWLITACQHRKIDSSNLNKGDMKKHLLNHPDFNSRTDALALEDALKTSMESASLHWLSSRADKHGFRLDAIQSTAYRWNALPEKNRKAGFSTVDYDGVLAVTDPDLFVRSLAAGFGPSKAFGCGLMLIRR